MYFRHNDKHIEYKLLCYLSKWAQSAAMRVSEADDKKTYL